MYTILRFLTREKRMCRAVCEVCWTRMVRVSRKGKMENNRSLKVYFKNEKEIFGKSEIRGKKG